MKFEVNSTFTCVWKARNWKAAFNWSKESRSFHWHCYVFIPSLIKLIDWYWICTVSRLIRLKYTLNWRQFFSVIVFGSVSTFGGFGRFVPAVSFRRFGFLYMPANHQLHRMFSWYKVEALTTFLYTGKDWFYVLFIEN